MQKAQTDIRGVNGHGHSASEGSDGDAGVIIHEDGSVVTRVNRDSFNSTLNTANDDNASTRAMVSPHPYSPSSTSQGLSTADLNGSMETATSATIPTIRISSESDRDHYEDEKSTSATPTEESVPTSPPTANGDGKQNGSAPGVVTETLEKPVQAAAAEPGEEVPPSPIPTSSAEHFSFSNKRLCERWLDNLFMVLYEVSRRHLLVMPSK